MRRLAPLLTIALLAACGPASAPTASPAPTGLPMHGPADAPSPETVRDGVLRFHPRSARVEPGVPYAYALYTHCWETMRIDFDGSHWGVTDVTDHDGALPLEYGNPYDQGTLEVDPADPDHARYRSDGGDMTLDLERLPGPVEVPICA